MKYFLLSILTLLAFEVFAQNFERRNVLEVIKEYSAVATNVYEVGSDRKITHKQMARIEAEATIFIACMEAEDWDNAHKAVKKLYRLDKTNRALHYTTIGYVSEMKNEIKKALKIYKRAISRYNNSEWAYFNMGCIYFSQAVEIIVNTDQMPLPHEQYIIERAKADEYFRKAMPLFEKGYQINKNIDFLHVLSVVYYKLGMMRKFDEIEQLIEE